MKIKKRYIIGLFIIGIFIFNEVLGLDLFLFEKTVTSLRKASSIHDGRFAFHDYHIELEWVDGENETLQEGNHLLKMKVVEWSGNEFWTWSPFYKSGIFTTKVHCINNATNQLLGHFIVSSEYNIKGLCSHSLFIKMVQANVRKILLEGVSQKLRPFNEQAIKKISSQIDRASFKSNKTIQLEAYIEGDSTQILNFSQNIFFDDRHQNWTDSLRFSTWNQGDSLLGLERLHFNYQDRILTIEQFYNNKQRAALYSFYDHDSISYRIDDPLRYVIWEASSIGTWKRWDHHGNLLIEQQHQTVKEIEYEFE